MPSINIYVPGPLALRLEPLKERINVSEVCQAALERAVDAEEVAGKGDRIQRVVERLARARSPKEEARFAGRQTGVLWAEEKAAWSELLQVADLQRVAAEGFALGEDLKVMANGSVTIRWRHGTKFKTEYLPESVPGKWFAEAAKTQYFDRHVWGFVEGAVEVRDAVKAELARRQSLDASHPDETGS